MVGWNVISACQLLLLLSFKFVFKECHLQFVCIRSSSTRYQNRVSLPWVQEHPDVFNDPTFTVTLAKAPTLSPSPPTSPRGYGDIQQPISSQESGSEVDEGRLSSR